MVGVVQRQEWPGWVEAARLERERHLDRATDYYHQSNLVWGTIHLVCAIPYSIPGINVALCAISYVAYEILKKDVPPQQDGPKPPPSGFYKRERIHAEIERVFRQKDKPLPLLVGEEGSGKSSIAHFYKDKYHVLDNLELYSVDRILKQLKGKQCLGCIQKGGQHLSILKRFFAAVEVPIPQGEELFQIAKTKFPELSEEVIRYGMELCDEYFPGHLIEVLDKVQAKGKEVTKGALFTYLSKRLKRKLFKNPTEKWGYFKEIDKELKKRVVGQDHVTEAMAKAMQNGAFLKKEWGTLGVFHFAGPTGVGKTSLAKAMADLFYDGNMLLVNMSEYKQPHRLSTLIGAAPGYVGHNKGGLISNKAREGPFLLLLDEIDKAHPEVVVGVIQNLAEEGVIFDQQTQSNLPMRGCFVIMTSNLGSNEIHSQIEGNKWFSKDMKNPEKVREVIEPKIKEHFGLRYDLLARLRTYYFIPLIGKEIIKEVTVKVLDVEGLERYKREFGITVQFSNDYIEAYNAPHLIGKRGVRWIRDDVERNLSNLLLHAVMNGDIPKGSAIEVDWTDDQDVIRLVGK